MGQPVRLSGIRVSDHERGDAAARLSAAHLDGRLTLPEFEHRLALALRARYSGDLDELFADLPVAEPMLPPLAGWWRRSAALALDHLLLALPVVLVLAAGALTGHAGGAATIAAIGAPLAALGYFTAAHGSRSGRTIGERAFGIAVRSDPHRSHVARRATHGQAFGRAVMLYVFAGLSFCGVGALNFLWPLFDVKKQAWHDKVAGTIVVRADALDFDRRRWSHRLRDVIRRFVHGPHCRHDPERRRSPRLPFPPR